MTAAILQAENMVYYPIFLSIIFWHGERKASQPVKIRRCVCSQKQHQLILEEYKAKITEECLTGGEAKTKKDEQGGIRLYSNRLILLGYRKAFFRFHEAKQLCFVIFKIDICGASRWVTPCYGVYFTLHCSVCGSTQIPQETEQNSNSEQQIFIFWDFPTYITMINGRKSNRFVYLSVVLWVYQSAGNFGDLFF